MLAGDLAGAGGAATTAMVRGASRERRSAVHRLFASGSTAGSTVLVHLSLKIRVSAGMRAEPSFMHASTAGSRVLDRLVQLNTELRVNAHLLCR